MVEKQIGHLMVSGYRHPWIPAALVTSALPSFESSPEIEGRSFGTSVKCDKSWFSVRSSYHSGHTGPYVAKHGYLMPRV